MTVADEDKDGTPGKMLDNILTTLFLVVMFGFGILVGLVAVLLGNDVCCKDHGRLRGGDIWNLFYAGTAGAETDR
ncbi:MAG: hypothetical protein ABIV48_01855, partial [Pyrinomonadaceae bacterium]